MVALDPTQLGLEIGGSGALGFLIGFAAKKIAKVIAVIIGAELVLFKFLESRGIISVRWDKLTAGLAKAQETGTAQAQDWVTTFVSTAGVGAGFVGGFALGFKKA
ncbi:FUN14 domain-containing protein [Halapricum desulfuricans]|uniref:Putative membrane protein, Fun14 family n=1 Tax=Halapricum desulfuricans TaxID=2841257 RepID=A0A897NFH2_9EURY|nr:FUN14 domain-containing protein [Halapricum desulfuricans]QSG09106.1 putative membrane protein, Fun14 family [Halapricum desulfuricans]QSG12163.1 putative membrane protein, Fun14 family [Halapricum desulfuricans]